MTDVFISYARGDQSEAERLAKRFTALGLTVWYDIGLTPGLDYAREISAKLHEAKAIVVCWTNAAAKSRWVFSEALVGLHRDNMVPISLDETLPPVPFASLQAIPMQKWSGRYRHTGWRALLDRLSAILGQPDLRDRDEAHAQRRRPGKALTVAFDSLWQDLNGSSPSNASSLREVLARRDSEQRQQLFRYISGGFVSSIPRGLIGTLIDFLSANASTDAIHRAIEAYVFIVDNFEPNDRIYIFGSGTGAYSARQLCAIINRCGILRRDQVKFTYQAVQFAHERKPRETDLERFRKEHSVALETPNLPDSVPPIAFLGLWESWVTRGLGDVLWPSLPLLPLALPTNVQNARLAAALDEDRIAFPIAAPVALLEEPDRRLKWGWFTGRGTDVVGGSRSKHFAEPFLWMLEGAEETGLEIDRSSERYLEAQQIASELAPSEPLGPLPLAAWITPAMWPLRPRLGPTQIEDVAAGAAKRWKNNRAYRPQSLRRLKRELSAPAETSMDS